jgi:glycosyltransferase involved in cell wall biosynthesis
MTTPTEKHVMEEKTSAETPSADLLSPRPPFRIAVVLGACNGAAFLAEQLQSLARQYRKPDSLLISDDASTDDAVAVAERFAGSAPFPVNIVRNATRLGSTGNFSAAIAAADGDVIALCDQDDVWYPEKLGAVERAFAMPDPPAIVVCDADVVDAELCPTGVTLWQTLGFAGQKRMSSSDSLAELLRRNVLCGAAMAFDARQRDRIVPIPRGWVHDYWIGVILSAAPSAGIAFIDEPLFAYRQHGRQQIGARRLSLREQWSSARAMDADYFNRLADQFAQAAERVGDSPSMELLLAKSTHCRRRAAFRNRQRSRALTIAGELLNGGYRRCGLGWKSAVQDTFAAKF